MANPYGDGPSYPEFVERDGRRYGVSVNTDRDGMIEYFQLFDIRTDDVSFEADYQIDSLTEAQIWEIVDELNGVERSAKAEDSPKAPALSEDEEDSDRSFFGGILDEDYPHYGELGQEFRDEAISLLSRNWGESQAFQDILLSELADSFEG